MPVCFLGLTNPACFSSFSVSPSLCHVSGVCVAAKGENRFLLNIPLCLNNIRKLLSDLCNRFSVHSLYIFYSITVFGKYGVGKYSGGN